MQETIVAIYRETMDRHRSRIGFRYKANGAWHPVTFGEMDRRVTATACALIERGVKAGDRVALLSENRPEWVQTDLAAIRIGAANVPIYLTLTAKQIAFILNDCQPGVVVCSNPKLLARVQEACEEVPSVHTLVLMDGEPLEPGKQEIVTLAALVAEGDSLIEKHSAVLAAREGAVTEDSMVSIIYTSGTTGNPKGVVLVHRNFASNALTLRTLIGLDHNDSCLSFLPLSHVFERIAYYLFLSGGGLINYAESIDHVAPNLVEVQPNFLASVPRVFEKIRQRVLDSVDHGPPVRKKLFEWAMGVGRRALEARQVGRSVDPFTSLQLTLADRLVFSKIRERTGGKLQYCISGGAPLPREVGAFFMTIGIDVLEGYGLTETSPVIAVNVPGSIKLGTVGRPIPRVEVKIADDGEILSRGPHIMKEYFNNPEATAEAIDAEGWFHTGDIGELDSGNFLRITDRKKEILVMSNGKNVAPAPLENAINLSALIAQSMIIGDNRNFITALIVPDYEALAKVAVAKGWSPEREALATSKEVHELLRGEVVKQTTDFARFEQIKEFVVLREEFSQDHDELSPKLSLKRRNILRRYQAEIDALYASSPAPVA